MGMSAINFRGRQFLEFSCQHFGLENWQPCLTKDEEFRSLKKENATLGRLTWMLPHLAIVRESKQNIFWL